MAASPIALEDFKFPIPRQLTVTLELKVQTRVTPILEATKTSDIQRDQKEVAKQSQYQ
jgi:hypothetical protein